MAEVLKKLDSQTYGFRLAHSKTIIQISIQNLSQYIEKK